MIWLDVWERNARAIAFYQKWGFAVVGTQTFQLGSDLQNDLLMQRAVEQ
jgi:ribosomal protein S18 acetylase RimI-like enzyme